MMSMQRDDGLGRLASSVMAVETRMMTIGGSGSWYIVHPVKGHLRRISLDFKEFVKETEDIRQPDARRLLHDSLGFTFFSTAVMLHEQIGRGEAIREVGDSWSKTVASLLRVEAPLSFALVTDRVQNLGYPALIAVAMNRVNVAGRSGRFVLSRSGRRVGVEPPRALSTPEAWRLGAVWWQRVYGPVLS